MGHRRPRGRGEGEGDPRHPCPHDRDRAVAGGMDEGHRVPSRAAAPGPSDHLLRSIRHHVRARSRRDLALRGRAGAIAEIDIDAPPAVVWSLVADVNVPTRFSDESIGAEWQSDERGVGAVFSGATVTPRSASGRCRASSTRVTNRAPSAGAPPIPTTRAQGGGSISNRPPAAPGCGSATSWALARRAPRWRSPPTRARRPGSCVAASTRCRPTCSTPSRASSSSPKQSP